MLASMPQLAQFVAWKYGSDSFSDKMCTHENGEGNFMRQRVSLLMYGDPHSLILWSTISKVMDSTFGGLWHFRHFRKWRQCLISEPTSKEQIIHFSSISFYFIPFHSPQRQFKRDQNSSKPSILSMTDGCKSSITSSWLFLTLWNLNSI